MVKSGSIKNSQLKLKTVAGWLQFGYVHGNSCAALLFPSNYLPCPQPSAVLVLGGKVAGGSEADMGIKMPTPQTEQTLSESMQFWRIRWNCCLVLFFFAHLQLGG